MRTIWQFISGLFRWSWRILRFIRECILNIILLFVLLIGAGVYLHNSKPFTPKQGALLLDLNGTIVDEPTANNRLVNNLSKSLLGSSKRQEQEISLFELVETLRAAKNDNKINGLVLSLNNFRGGDQPSLLYIGKALNEFKQSGKQIYAIGDSYTQSQYYLASFANEIYLSPQGSVNLQGFSTNSLYFKTLLDKLKVSTHIFRVGTYKSAVEPFIRDNMSPEAKEADSLWIGELWNNYLSTIAKNRSIPKEQVFPGATTLISALQKNGGDTAQYALEQKLVDKLATRSEIEELMSQKFGWNQLQQEFNYINYIDYTPSPDKKEQVKDDKIAVIFANGAIIDGEKVPGSVGGDTTATEIRQARLNNDVKAIVLRVNSPGGSVTASEVIRAELVKARAVKPVIISMGGTAASGGYWISTPANYIIASPSTLTGSIGIFGVISTFENSLDAIGVHTDGVSTSPLADATVTKALPTEFSQIMQMSIKKGYLTFIGLVAKSRNKTATEVDQIAQGRVWTGSDALKNGLVDQLGDFDDAIKKAAELAKLESYEILWSTQPSDFFSFFSGPMVFSAREFIPDIMQSWLPQPVNQLAETVKSQSALSTIWNDPQNQYAICLSCADIR